MSAALALCAARADREAVANWVRVRVRDEKKASVVSSSIIALAIGAVAAGALAVGFGSWGTSRTAATPLPTYTPAPKPTPTTSTEEIAQADTRPATTTATTTTPSASSTVYMEWPANSGPAYLRPQPDGSMYWRATALRMKGDDAGARALLEPRVFGPGGATVQEVTLLRFLCKQKHDKTCTNKIDSIYPR